MHWVNQHRLHARVAFIKLLGHTLTKVTTMDERNFPQSVLLLLFLLGLTDGFVAVNRILVRISLPTLCLRLMSSVGTRTVDLICEAVQSMHHLSDFLGHILLERKLCPRHYFPKY